MRCVRPQVLMDHRLAGTRHRRCVRMQGSAELAGIRHRRASSRVRWWTGGRTNVIEARSMAPAFAAGVRSNRLIGTNRSPPGVESHARVPDVPIVTRPPLAPLSPGMRTSASYEGLERDEVSGSGAAPRRCRTDAARLRQATTPGERHREEEVRCRQWVGPDSPCDGKHFHVTNDSRSCGDLVTALLRLCLRVYATSGR